MSLYTKYRPRDWDSVIGQDTISTILRSALRLGQVGHAYIFTGSRGTGKTTSARILAKGVNCENLQDGNPCHTCANCISFDDENMLDIIEIDGASNNGVDDVRLLIEKARFEPTQGKYKVYIIDEVHMLSTAAFNALLKTLEEPPDHVKFILATTEIEKVPETIRSRSLRFDFRKIVESDLKKRLEFVVKAEGITAEDEALSIIAKAARGGMRDALTLLEQHIINKEVSTAYVRSSLSLLEEALIEETLEALRTKDIEKTLHILDTLRNRHVQVREFFDQILYTLRDHMFASIKTPAFHEYESIFAIFESSYAKIRVIPDAMLLIEITLIRAVKRGEIENISAQADNKKNGGKTVPSEIQNNEATGKVIKNNGGYTPNGESEGDKIPQSRASLSFPGLVAGNLSERSPTKVLGDDGKVQSGFTPENFGTFGHESTLKPQLGKESDKIGHESSEKNENQKEKQSFSFISLLNTLKTTKPALVVDLKNSQFEVDGCKLKLSFTKEWNYSRVNTPTIKGTIAEALEKIFGGNWEIECSLGIGQGDIAEGVF